MTLRRSHRPFWRTRTLRYTLIIASAVAGVLLFLLASASSNTPFFERTYPVLLGLNATIALMMLALVSVLVWRLAKRYRANVFGARLMVRFALSFALMGVVPGALIYIVSVQFLSRSIESWFDVRVDKALESGLALGHTVLDSMLSDLTRKGRTMALELSESDSAQISSQLGRLREQTGVQDAMLFTASGHLVASASSGTLDTLLPQMPPQNVLSQLKLRRSYAAIESPLPDSDSAHDVLRMRVVTSVPSSNLSLFPSETLFLQLVQDVPHAITVNADEVENGMRDYQELSLSRSGLRRIYTVTLTLALLVAVFFALGTAFLLATWLTAPLLLLAEGTKAVAGGDYRPMQAFDSSDELGTLTQSFNTMTRQLEEARVAVEHNRGQLENAKTYLESILTNLSAGVLVFDQAFCLVTVNHGAERILEMSLKPELGKPLKDIAGLETLAQVIERAFEEQSGDGPDWQKQIALERTVAAPRIGQLRAGSEGDGQVDPLTVLARGSRCPVGDAQGYLIVFDDVSDVISAQRSIAWSEVARRLAHEIKNPLTPIQLSAERLQMKLQGKLVHPYAEVLERGVSTIVNQVTAMKRMVDDFRDFARAPSAAMAALDLNSLVSEVLALYGVTATNDGGAGIQLQMAADLPMIRGDATRLRQVIHNLVQNAQDATLDRDHPMVLITTERIEGRAGGTQRAARSAMVRLTVTDNGSGFPARILARAFEPYVTTKSRGTGLGLAVVKKIVDEHEARIEVRNRDEGGASVAILFTVVADRHLAVA